MVVRIEESWRQQLSPEFEQPYFVSLTDFVKDQYARFRCHPPAPLIFSAFDHCPFNLVKVVILGQDPYHGQGQANGLCFSVNDGVQPPPSLQNIFKEIAVDTGTPIPPNGNLERWADQGVLLLNAVLTVRESEAGSHQKKGWETFTDAVIRQLSDKKKDLVFILWGNYAKKKGDFIDKNRHLVLHSAHP
ncbi:MAG: uracil-DNA glycosylase, partial [Crocinitomicaceae bacterium]|nr:uracil-DNA glycosylase [Crocinitomicaceae bacterium]